MSTIYPKQTRHLLYDEAMRRNALGHFIMRDEGRMVDKEGYHVPFKGPSGARLIGYGHRIQPGESFDRLSEDEARALMHADIRKARQDAADIHGDAWTKMSDRDKDIATDFTFNLGRRGYREEWPRLQESLEAGYSPAIKEESERSYTRGGRKYPMTRRNRALREHFFEKGIYPRSPGEE
jgi:GH24 family phage-related lysozyme (muramidase)